jgi:HEAT repeat protein
MQRALLDFADASSDPVVRFWMVHGLNHWALSEKGDESVRLATRNVLRGLLNDTAPAPRIAAAETLGLLGEADRALPVLVAAMSDPQEAIRIQAVSALEKLGEAARPAEATLRAATTDSSEYVKRISTRALQKLDATKR